MNIYVGNLPKSTSEEAIRDLFSGHGNVDEVKLIKDRFSGDLRGFGFVEMSERSEGLKAIDQINGQEVGGNRLVVNEAKPRSESSSTGSRNHSYRKY
jgi:RNA recognition motif-containing protein